MPFSALSPLLAQSAARRLALAVLLVAPLWAVVAWALSWGAPG